MGNGKSMRLLSLAEELKSNSYPGRGIVLGKSEDGKTAVAAYFIMGRSVNSRNRIFVEDGEGIRTQAFDPAKLVDPSLVIYAPVRVLGNKTIVTNGDQTDTIYEGMDKQMTFEQSLRSREFEPDAPNYTPRISGLLSPDGSYKLSILKAGTANGAPCLRYFYEYEQAVPGAGRFISTYEGFGDPLPSFHGEPVEVAVPELDSAGLAGKLWAALNADNRVSLYVCVGGDEVIINKYEEEA